MNICVIGTGYVGLVTGACLADLGNNVICVDKDKAKVDSLKKGRVTIYEPGLQELVRRNKKQSRIRFTTSIKDGVKKSTVIFIAVGTPPRPTGEADLTFVESVSKEIAMNMTSYKLIVEKSTVPIETGEWIEQTINANNKKNTPFDVASNPEFLREGSAINDFMRPNRIVIGVNNKRSEELLLKLYSPLKVPIVVTNIKSAEIIKHASNSFLATKISFINAISNICEKVGADVTEVAKGMGMDKRIGPAFLDAGVGFGGFCFPKDLLAFIHISGKLGYDFRLLKEVERINTRQKELFISKIKENIWNLNNKTIGILGLSFKPNTDDIRYAPSLDIIKALKEEGAKIRAFDPHAMEKAKKELKDVVFCRDAYDAARKSNCLVIVTEWNEFKELDFVKIKRLLKQPLVIDGRNIYSPKKMKKMGFKYVCIGRKT
ncbi:MAG: UDP-glucose/GDP-mannose dehydrogenase family protein [Candidatus Omnitrophica bacterium]|nr:UDP-glucose/GDP-mannose dehydrogenase family protein [Candidatus Omnitrophota bacterium]